MNGVLLLLALMPCQPSQYEMVRRPAAYSMLSPVAVLTYQQGIEKALETGTDLMVYVGIKSVPNKRTIVCETPSLTGYPAKCIVIARPMDGVIRWVQTLDESGKRIDLPLREAVTASPAPFSASSTAPRPASATADGNGAGRSSRLSYNPSHRCQACGRTVTVIAGPGPAPGTHRHQCPCGQAWYH